MRYFVVIASSPNGITVGPFKSQHLAFTWANKNVKRFGWHTSMGVSRAEAKKVAA